MKQKKYYKLSTKKLKGKRINGILYLECKEPDNTPKPIGKSNTKWRAKYDLLIKRKNEEDTES